LLDTARGGPVTDNSQTGLLTGLGEFAASIDLDAVPEAAQHQATLCILDTIGCIVLGTDTPDATMMLSAEKARGGAGEATVLGTTTRLPVEAAARLNGYLGDIFELNDLLAGHPSIAVIPAAMALAEARGSSGAQLLKAVIAGLETTSRIYAAYRGQERPYPEIGNGFVGFMNTIGVAAAASTLLGFDADRTANALAVGAALAGWCPAEALFRDGGTIKPILFGGWPASVGIQATGYAQHGLTGPRKVLDGDFGFYRAISYNFDTDVVLAPDRWFTTEPRRKVHACCGYMHSAIDVAASIRRDYGKDAFSKGPVKISMLSRVIDAVSKPRPPRSGNEARFHLEYCVAIAALYGDLILPEHTANLAEYLADPDVQSLMQRIQIIREPKYKSYYECEIELTTPAGREVRVSGKAPKGSLINPLTDDEVIAKFKRLVSSRLDDAAAAAYAARVQSLAQETDCRWLATALA
jgi:2-methylcitrate dehydratase PrpD